MYISQTRLFDQSNALCCCKSNIWAERRSPKIYAKNNRSFVTLYNKGHITGSICGRHGTQRASVKNKLTRLSPPRTRERINAEEHDAWRLETPTTSDFHWAQRRKNGTSALCDSFLDLCGTGAQPGGPAQRLLLTPHEARRAFPGVYPEKGRPGCS